MTDASSDIDARAAEWALVANGGDLDSGQAQYLEAWLASDPRHRGAFLRAQAGLRLVDRLRPDLAPVVSPIRGQARLPPSRRVMMIGGGGAIAAGLVAVAAPVLLRGERFRTGLGEIRRVPLQDGSSATINTASIVDVKLGRHRRDIDVVRGEAWFDVHPDRARPFLVRVGDIRVQAVGTAFSVRPIDGAVDVTVTEGVVEAWDVRRPHARTRIKAGAAAMLDGSKSLSAPIALPGPELERRLAWREGLIILNGQTLAQAAAEFNRYNTRRLEVGNLNGETTKLVGVFSATDPEGFARAVSPMLRATIVLGPRDIEFSRR
jgi:transmembrane sensor